MSVRAVLWRKRHKRFRALVNHFGGAGAALEALPALARRGGAERPGKIYPLEDAERELAEARRQGITWVALGEPDYPARHRCRGASCNPYDRHDCRARGRTSAYLPAGTF